MIRVCIAAFVACVLCGSGASAQANQAIGASPADLERILKNRLRLLQDDGRPFPLTALEVRPAGKPRTLMDGRTALPRQIRRAIAGSSVVSVLYYDGEKVRYDWRRDDIPEDARIWGYSMGKSIASWLVGKAYCDGRIDSLDDRIGKYVPGLDNSFYGDASIGDALDMSTGDRDAYSRNGIAPRDLFLKIEKEGGRVIDALLLLGNARPGKKEFYYRSPNAYAVGAVLFSVTPEGLGEFAGKAMADDAGLGHPSIFLTDREGFPETSTHFYAHRMDWLRLGVRIAEQFEAEGCIGDYLRSAAAEAVPTKLRSFRKYGKFFWFDRRRTPVENDAWMTGGGCSRVLMDLDRGRVLAVHALRCDYGPRDIVNAAFGGR